MSSHRDTCVVLCTCVWLSSPTISAVHSDPRTYLGNFRCILTRAYRSYRTVDFPIVFRMHACSTRHKKDVLQGTGPDDAVRKQAQWHVHLARICAASLPVCALKTLQSTVVTSSGYEDPRFSFRVAFDLRIHIRERVPPPLQLDQPCARLHAAVLASSPML